MYTGSGVPASAEMQLPSADKLMLIDLSSSILVPVTILLQPHTICATILLQYTARVLVAIVSAVNHGTANRAEIAVPCSSARK